MIFSSIDPQLYSSPNLGCLLFFKSLGNAQHQIPNFHHTTHFLGEASRFQFPESYISGLVINTKTKGYPSHAEFQMEA